MKKLLTILLFCLSAIPIYSQNEVGTFTILAGGSIGEFMIDAGGNFNDLYTNRQLSYTGVFGLGNGESFLIGKYRIFKATGQSKLQNIDATGKADWKQTILGAGFRYHPHGSSLYIDALYVFNHAEETIGTENPPVDFLAASQKLDDNGFAFALGIAPKLISPIALDLEVEYSFMLRKPVNDSGRRVPNLGGLYYSAGLSFYFNN